MVKYTIKVEDELWEKFKRTITKDKTINEAVVELIRKKVEKQSHA
jgi:hypothetical protein